MNPKRREGPTLNATTRYYYFDEKIGFRPDVRRVRFSLKTRDPEKAHWLWEREYRKQWRQYYGEADPEKPRQILFNQISEEFINYERDIKKVKTWKTIRDRLFIIGSHWGNVTLNSINSDRLAELDSFLHRRGLAPKTINDYMGILKTTFFYAVRKKYLTDNPIKEVKPYTVDEKRREYSPDEIRRILVAADRIEKGARDNTVLQKYARSIILLLLYTGMRLGELINLKWDNIQSDRIVLRRTETKQRKEKVIPLTSGISTILEALRAKNSPFVIPRKATARISSHGSTSTILAKMRAYSGIEDFDFHSLRHTAASIMVSNALGKGVGIADIQKILGHSKVETTMRYMHSDFGRMKKAVEILEEISIINETEDDERPPGK